MIGLFRSENPLYRQSFLAVLPIAIVSPLLGMAEGALADFLAMAGVRTTRGAVAGGNRRMAELTTVQMRVAEASALIDAARLLIFRDLAEAYAMPARGEPIGVDMRLRNRRDQAFCVRLLVQAVVRAVRTLLTEETQVSMLIGVAVGYELAHELMDKEKT